MRVRWWRGLGNREGIRHTSLVLRRCGTPYFARRVSLCDATVCPKLATNRTRDRRIQSRARHKPIFMSDRFRVLERASAARIHRSCLDAEHRADILYGNARCAPKTVKMADATRFKTRGTARRSPACRISARQRYRAFAGVGRRRVRTDAMLSRRQSGHAATGHIRSTRWQH